MPFLLMMTALASSGEGWRSRSEHGGLALKTRGVEGSPHEEVRVTARCTAASEAVCEAVWGGQPKGKPLEPGFKRRDVLLETEHERITYEQLSAPLVSDRDYTLRVVRQPLPSGGCDIVFNTVNDRGPPPKRGLVRIPVIRGSWSIRPLSSGGTYVVYTVYSEPGGSIPAFLSRGPTRAKAVDFLKLILARLEKPHARR